MGFSCRTSGCAQDDTWPWGVAGCPRGFPSSFPHDGAAQGVGDEPYTGHQRGALHLVHTGLRTLESPGSSRGHPGSAARSRAHRLIFRAGWNPAPAQEPWARARGNRAQRGTDLHARSWLSLPPCCPDVPAHRDPQRQPGFAKFGLAPPEKRCEPAKGRTVRFLERGPPGRGQGNARTSAPEVHI